MTLPIEIGADKSFGSIDCSASPISGHACSPCLEVAVDFKRCLADDLWICDLTVWEGCSKVDYSERNLTNGTWAGNIAMLPLLPDGAGLFRPVTPQQASEYRWQDSLFESGSGRRAVLHAPG
jgi:hypothetical protein